jgi:hypothetical protein
MRAAQRVFEIALEHCPGCGSELKIIAGILELPAIERMLDPPVLPASAPQVGATASSSSTWTTPSERRQCSHQ